MGHHYCEINRSNYKPRTPWQIFHWLWSRDVGRPGYDKKLWEELEKHIPGPK